MRLPAFFQSKTDKTIPSWTFIIFIPSVFLSNMALLKALYLSTFEATKKMDYAGAQLGTGLW